MLSPVIVQVPLKSPSLSTTAVYRDWYSSAHNGTARGKGAADVEATDDELRMVHGGAILRLICVLCDVWYQGASCIKTMMTVMSRDWEVVEEPRRGKGTVLRFITAQAASIDARNPNYLAWHVLAFSELQFPLSKSACRGGPRSFRSLSV